MTLREEVRDWGALDGTRPVTWREAVHEWRDYILDRRDVDAVFENAETGERVAGSDPHRFAPEYADKQYAKLKDLERGLREAYGRRLHTAMLTLTASSTSSDGRARAPVDHLDDLLGSWEAVRRALNRVLDGRRWEYLAILEPHASGYLHVHVAVFVDGVVRAESFAPVIEAHLRNCEGAEREAHAISADDPEDSVVSVMHVGADRAEDRIGNLGTYLAEYLGTYSGNPLESPDNVQMANAILWATGRQRWRPSNGAQAYMAYGGENRTTAWELVGVRDANGEFHAAEEGAGGVRRFTTGTDPPPYG